MTSKHLFQWLNLQLFAEGGGGDGGTVAGGEMGVTDGVANHQGQVQVTDADGVTAQNIDREAEFNKLIKGEYKDLYDAKMQNTIQKRLKGTKETVEKYEALSPMLELLGKKYGVDPSDAAALSAAIEEDDSYWEDEALERGIPVEQLKEIRKMERENADLKRQMEEIENKKKAGELYSSWMRQADSLKAIYPSFDLEAEMRNPQFVDLLRVPTIDVRTAYEVVHKDEILPAAMQFAAKTAEQKVTAKIAANGARPAENGMASQSASVHERDVSQLSRDQILEIQRRIAQGERVDLTKR